MKSKESCAPPRGKSALGARACRALLLWTAILSACASLPGREFPPDPLPPSPVALPAPTLRVLPNGLRVAVVERHSLPLAALRFVVTAGAEADPAERPGTAQLVASLLAQGTKRRSAREIAEAIDFIGGTLEQGADWDFSFAGVTVLSDHVRLGFDILADIVTQPAFDPPEVDRKRQETLSALELMRDDPAYIADTALRSVTLAGTPYGHPRDGTVESVREITAENLREFHAAYYRPAHAVLAIVGDLGPEKAFALAEEFFGGWKGSSESAAPPRRFSASPSGQIIAVDKPDAVQTEIRVGHLGIPRDNPEYYALTVANQILGGPATNRLFKSLRSQKGLTYGASSDLVCHRYLGTWVAKTFTRTGETIQALQVMLEEINRLGRRSITEPELRTAQGYLSGHLALEFESSEGVAAQILDLAVHGLPPDYWNNFAERTGALRVEDVSSAAERHLDSQRTVIVLVGNVARFEKDLARLAPLRIIPFHSLDFASSTLENTHRTAGRK